VSFRFLGLFHAPEQAPALFGGRIFFEGSAENLSGFILPAEHLVCQGRVVKQGDGLDLPSGSVKITLEARYETGVMPFIDNTNNTNRETFLTASGPGYTRIAQSSSQKQGALCECVPYAFQE